MAPAWRLVAAIDIAMASRGCLAGVVDRVHIAPAHDIQIGHAG
jgi:hypothetical protein